MGLIRKLRLRIKAYRTPECMDCENCAGMGAVTRNDPWGYPVEPCPDCLGTGIEK